MKEITGMTTDYFGRAYRSTTKCAQCGKIFPHGSAHAYKRIYFGGRRKMFCSYHCLREWDRQQQEKDKMRCRSATNPNTGKYEKKPLAEWAQELDIDYAFLWYKNMVDRISIPEALSVYQCVKGMEK